MKIPPEITFRGILRTAYVDELIRRRVDKLERFCGNLIACRLAVEKRQEHQRSGNPYRVRLEITLPPSKVLVVTSEPNDHEMHAQLRSVLRSTFQTMERRLKEAVHKRRGDVKTHMEPRALIARLFREDGYGFLKTPDGREFYFHRNSVLHGDFDRLEIGVEVRFEPGMGEEGPQASSVQIAAMPGPLAGGAGDPAARED